MTRNRFFSLSEARRFLALGLPVLVTQIAQMGMNFVDTAMTGRASTADMAAVAVSGSIWVPVSLLGMGCLLSLPAMMAHLVGGGEQRRDEKGFGRRPRMPGRIGDPPCGEVAGTAQEGLPSGRIVAARPAGRADRQREIVHRLPHRNRIGRRPALRSDIVPHAKPLPVERRPRQEIERPLHHRVHTDRIDPERTEMLEEITRRGGLSAPPHHDRPPRRGIHVESSDRTLVDPARTRHEAFRRHDLLEARQPLARKRRIQLQPP
ncbi:MATE family efflux transporter, partial [Desulfovibrio piger]|uniref:MATE family efflux transporter n=1 Tax=Desulfovibrio piger TaxID=901 RepID=UPI0026F33352